MNSLSPKKENEAEIELIVPLPEETCLHKKRKDYNSLNNFFHCLIKKKFNVVYMYNTNIYIHIDKYIKLLITF
jgi:hypothetical protein